jgi:hypothetical protein
VAILPGSIGYAQDRKPQVSDDHAGNSCLSLDVLRSARAAMAHLTGDHNCRYYYFAYSPLSTRYLYADFWRLPICSEQQCLRPHFGSCVGPKCFVGTFTTTNYR